MVGYYDKRSYGVKLVVLRSQLSLISDDFTLLIKRFSFKKIFFCVPMITIKKVLKF